MPKTKLTITWSTNYNGVWVGPGEIDEEGDEYDLLDRANEEMGLPGHTFDMCKGLHCFEDPVLTEDQIQQLIDIVKSNEILADLYGDFDVEFEYDTVST